MHLDSESLAEYRRLLLAIHRDVDLSNPRCICLTGADCDEPKVDSAIALALAATLGAERRVILVDANLARPQLAARLSINPKLGLSDVLERGVFLSEAIFELASENYDVLVAGRVGERTAELLSSRRMTVVLRGLKACYDLIIVDGPMVRDRSCADMLAQDFDAVYLVAQLHKTHREAAGRTLSMLHAAGVTVRGCILTSDAMLAENPADTTPIANPQIPIPDRTHTASPNHESGTAHHLQESNCLSSVAVSTHTGFAHHPTRCDFIAPADTEYQSYVEAICTSNSDTTTVATPSQLNVSPTVTFEPLAEQSEIADRSDAADSTGRPCEPPDSCAESGGDEARDSISHERILAQDILEKLESICPFDGEARERFSGDTQTQSDRAVALGAAPEKSVDEFGEIPQRSEHHTPTLAGSWAHNALAVCGALLTLAGIFYVAVDLVFWF